MKKILLSAAFLFGAMASQAQFDQGSIIVTGDLGFSSSSGKVEVSGGGTSTTTDLPSVTGFNIGVSGGYFIADNLAVGLGIGFGTTSINDDLGDGDYDKLSTNLTVVAPFVRYYIPYTDKFAFFGQLDLGFGFGGIKDEFKLGGTTTTSESGLSVTNIGISPGFTYFIHDNIGLDMRFGFLGYNSSSTTIEGGGTTNKLTNSTLGLDLGLNSLMFGLSVFF